jgi:hypothetical protein
MPEESQLTLMNLAKAGMERSDLMGEVCGETNTNSLDVESEVKAKLGYLSEQNEELLRTVCCLRTLSRIPKLFTLSGDSGESVARRGRCNV